MSEQTEGAKTVAAVEEWISGYLALPDPAYGLVLALWAIGTWSFSKFYSYPYLAIGGQKGSGKTRALELLRDVCLSPWLVTGSSAAPIYRKLLDRDGKMVLLFDEAETTSSEQKNLMSQVLNAGYRRGHTIPKVVGGQVIDYPAYCPKAFAAIGDVSETLRTRSIVIRLERGRPEREYWPEAVEGEAAALVARIKEALQGIDEKAEYPDFLATRNREIWGAMFGLAKGFGLDKKQIERLTRVAADNDGWKTAPKKRTQDEEESEEDSIDAAYAGRAIADLKRVLKEGERYVLSVDAVERMRALADGPWRTFKGTGLDPLILSKLVGRAGLEPKQFKLAKGKVGRGYPAAAIKGAGL